MSRMISYSPYGAPTQNAKVHSDGTYTIIEFVPVKADYEGKDLARVDIRAFNLPATGAKISKDLSVPVSVYEVGYIECFDSENPYIHNGYDEEYNTPLPMSLCRLITMFWLGNKESYPNIVSCFDGKPYEGQVPRNKQRYGEGSIDYLEYGVPQVLRDRNGFTEPQESIDHRELCLAQRKAREEFWSLYKEEKAQWDKEIEACAADFFFSKDPEKQKREKEYDEWQSWENEPENHPKYPQILKD